MSQFFVSDKIGKAKSSLSKDQQKLNRIFRNHNLKPYYKGSNVILDKCTFKIKTLISTFFTTKPVMYTKQEIKNIRLLFKKFNFKKKNLKNVFSKELLF